MPQLRCGAGVVASAEVLRELPRRQHRSDDVTISAVSEGVRGYALDIKAAEALWVVLAVKVQLCLWLDNQSLRNE